MKKKKSIYCIGLLFLIFFAVSLSPSEEEKTDILVGVTPNPFVTMTSLGGKGTASFMELFQKGADEFKKQQSRSVTLKIFPAPKFLFKALNDKTVDFGLLALPVYLAAKKRGIAVKPFVNVVTKDKKALQYCIYVHKDSGIKNLKQLKGKSFVMDFPYFMSTKDALPPEESYITWIAAKKLLEKEGIKAPLKGFFKDVRILPVPGESIVYSVLLKKFDATLSSSTFLQSLRNYDTGFLDVVPVTCLEGGGDSPVVYRMGIDPEILKKMKTFFSVPKESKTLKGISKEFKGITFGYTGDKDYDLYFKWLKEAQQKGWFQEFNNIMKDTPRPKKK